MHMQACIHTQSTNNGSSGRLSLLVAAV